MSGGGVLNLTCTVVAAGEATKLFRIRDLRSVPLYRHTGESRYPGVLASHTLDWVWISGFRLKAGTTVSAEKRVRKSEQSRNYLVASRVGSGDGIY